MKKLLAGFALVLLMLGIADMATASIVEYSDRTSFSAQGNIAYNSNFNDFGPNFGIPGDPFTRGAVTYRSTENLTWGSATKYSTNSQTLMGNNFWTPVVASVATAQRYNMLGFDIGNSSSNTVTVIVNSNVNSYIFNSLHVGNTLNGNLSFLGYTLSSGEYVTGFNIIADAGLYDGLPGITNVAVGNTRATPIPAAVWLLGSGVAGLFGLGRKFRKS